jgi:hypothetical protein
MRTARLCPANVSVRRHKASSRGLRRFRDAALRGLEYTLAHPQGAAELVHERHPGTIVEAARGEITLMTPYPAAGYGA